MVGTIQPIHTQINNTIGSGACLEMIDSTTYCKLIEGFTSIYEKDSNNLPLEITDYFVLIKLINTLNIYERSNSYCNFKSLRSLYSICYNKFKIQMQFGPGEAGGEYSQKYNIWIGGYPRASSMFKIIDWEYPSFFSPIYLDCECAYPPCDN